MKIEQINELVIKKLNLIEYGFDYIDYKFDFNQGLFIHASEKKQKILSYGFGYDYKDLSHFEFGTNPFNSFIYFTEVEKILQKIIVYECSEEIAKIEDFRLRNYHGNVITIFNNQKIESEFKVIFQNNRVELGNLNFLVEKSIIALTKNHLPFFERVKDLQYVNDEIIDKVPQMELGSYIPGKYMNPKKLIIMKLCNNPNYEGFKEWLIRTFEEVMRTEPDRYIEDYKVVLSTIEFLDSGKYKEIA